MTKRAPKKAATGATVTLESVDFGDFATLESGLEAEVAFRLGASTFVRFADSAPREICSLPSTSVVISVRRRERVASVATEVTDPLSGGGRK